MTGSGASTIITVQPPFGMGSPPIADWTVPGINVTSSNVIITNVLISNFTVGILASNADSLRIDSVHVSGIQGIGIHILSSENVEANEVTVEGSEESNIIVESSSTGMSISDSLIGWSEESGVIVRQDSDFFEMRQVVVDGNKIGGASATVKYLKENKLV